MTKFNRLPKAIREATKGFKQPVGSKKAEAARKNGLADLSYKIAELRYKDIRWRVKRRGPVTWLAYLLLFVQNALVMYLIWYPLQKNRTLPAGYYQLMITLISATLAESAFVIRTIVTWLFKEISYTYNNASNAGQETDASDSQG